MRKIVVLSGGHLCHNPRVMKEANTLSSAGYDVEVLGACFDRVLAERDREIVKEAKWKFTPVVDTTGKSMRSGFARFFHRGRTWLGRQAFRHFGYENHWQLGYAAPELLSKARTRKADLFIAHLEQALWVGNQLLNEGRNVGVDMEDWYSDDLLPEAQKSRPLRLLISLEGTLLKSAIHRTCPSLAMSYALAEAYGCAPPTVIYNTFPWLDRHSIDGLVKDRIDCRLPSLHWYSQTLGAGRGLEDLFKALTFLDPKMEIHLRGKPVQGFEDWLLDLPPSWRSKIHIHALVPNDVLLSRISEHDIGFAGEMKFCRSRDLTVTNKILHYLLGGLAIIASDTAGQKEIADKAPGAIHLYPSGDAEALAKHLNHLLSSPDILKASKLAALKAAKQTFCWENTSLSLISSVENALAGERLSLESSASMKNKLRSI